MYFWFCALEFFPCQKIRLYGLFYKSYRNKLQRYQRWFMWKCKINFKINEDFFKKKNLREITKFKYYND